MHFLNRVSTTVLQNRPFTQRLAAINEIQKFGITQSTTLLAQKSKKEKQEEKLNIISTLPEKPKKPHSTYIRFLATVRPKLIQQQPDISITEIIKQAAAKWKAADKDTIARLQTEYLNDLEVYKKQIEGYNSKLTDPQKAVLDELARDSKRRKVRLQLKKKYAQLGRPKRPLNAYMLFASTKKSEYVANSSVQEWAAKIATEWKTLPEHEKSKYTKKAKELSEQYKIEIIKWEKEMAELNINLESKSSKSKSSKPGDKSKSARSDKSAEPAQSELTSSEATPKSHYSTNEDRFSVPESCFSEIVSECSHNDLKEPRKIPPHDNTDRPVPDNSKTKQNHPNDLINRVKDLFKEFVKKKD